MSTEDRPDINTRFKKGQSGNPSGRPKGRKDDATQIKDVLFKPIRIRDGNSIRTVSKLAAALEVCLNKALKGDLRAFMKVMEIAEKFDSFRPPLPGVIEIRRVIVDPKEPPIGDEPL